MRRNGSAEQQRAQSCSTSSGWLGGLLSLAGGVGLGAGLLYLMDPDQGAKRRQRIARGAQGLASGARDYAGEGYGALSGAVGGLLGSVGSALGSARDYTAEKFHDAGDYASSTASGITGGISGYASGLMDDARAYAQRKVFGETRAEHNLHMAVCALSSMALGAALMYAFDPQSGRARRRQVVEGATDLYNNAGQYARQAADAVKSGYGTASEAVKSGYNTAVESTGNAVKTGYQAVADKVGTMTGRGGEQQQSQGNKSGAKA